MQQFRNLLKGWVGKLLLAIFILPFAFFGIEGIILNSGSSDYALSVNGVEISKAELDRAINNQRDAMVQRMGGQIDPSMFTDEMLRPRVIETLIQRELLTQAVKKEGLYVANESVKSYVRNMPQFRDETSGAFSQDKLETVLARAGYTPVRFYSELSQGMITEQLQQAIGLSAFITDDELKSLVKLDGQKRDVTFTSISADKFKDKVEVSDDEISTYFEANQQQYRTEETVQIQYLAFKASDFSKDIDVTEDELLAEYDHYVKELSGQERRRASHILVEVGGSTSDQDAKARIEEVKAKLDAGEDFATLAKAYSDDTATVANGGDLDYSGRGVYDEAFENALFALKEGETSGVVKTEYGYHIIKLTGIETPKVASLDDKRDDLKTKVIEAKATAKLNAAIDELNELTYAAGDLSAVSERFSKPVLESEAFSRRGGTGIAANPKMVEAAFSDQQLNEGMNSSAIELDDGSVVVLRVSQHNPERDRTLDEVKDQLVTAVKDQKAREQAKAQAEQLITKLKAGESLDALSSEFGIAWTNHVGVSRQTRDVPATVLTKLFELPAPTAEVRSTDVVELPSGELQIVMLTSVTEGAYTLEGDEAVKAHLAYSNSLGQSEFNNYLASLKDAAEIVQH